MYKSRKQSSKKGGKTTRRRNNQGLTENIQKTRMKRMRKAIKHLDSRLTYPDFEWAEIGSRDYWDAISDINKSYRNMLEIGKTKDAFTVAKEGVSTMLTAKTKEEFEKAKYNVNRRYTNHVSAKKAVLQNFRLETELIPDPRKYCSLPERQPPTNREVLVKEQILTFEQYLSSLNVFKCSLCLECQIEEKPYVEDPDYVCKGCKTRKDSNYFIKNNLHPVWYHVDDKGNRLLDSGGNEIPQYHIPEELSTLSMYEKLLIRRCANFVPTVHLRNGVFGIKGHAVTFPQDITDMCDELPQRKETIVTFIRNIGNKETSSVFPTSLRVNRIKVLNALVWLKKHNQFYANIQIKEENLDWMDGKEEVNLGTEGVNLDIRCTSRSKKENEEEEYVSKSHETEMNDVNDDFQVHTVHANETRRVPSGRQAEPMNEFVEIAKRTDQTASVLAFPAIDHTTPTS